MEFDESFLGHGRYTFERFEFENGEHLDDADVEYFISGTPKYDDEGNIINAIVFFHSYMGTCYSINELYNMTSQCGSFNKEEYLLISITALGVPDSCSPSKTGLNHQFPKYSSLDCVNFQRQFLKEFLGIERVFGVTGRGMGGYGVYTWACEYPDEMDFIIVSDSCYKTGGYRYAFSKVVGSIIDSSDAFYSDTYDASLSRSMVSINKLVYSNFFSRKIFYEMTNDEIDVLMDDFVEDGLFIDIYDLKYRNDLVLEYDVEDKLKNIKVPTLILANDNDIYYYHEFDTLPLNDLIENSEIVLYKTPENPEAYWDVEFFGETFDNFLKKVKKNKS